MKLPHLIPIALSISLILSGCSTLPHAGPSYSSIKKMDKSNTTSDEINCKVNIVDLNTTSGLLANQNRNFLQFTNNFINEKSNNKYVDKVGKGDTLKISIMETPPAILFIGGADTGAPRTGLIELPVVIVDSQGFISLPFIGDLKVLNKTPSQIQKEINEKLSGIANRPQVIVSIMEKRSSNATIIGDGFSGKMPLTAKGEKLLDAVTLLGNNMYDIKDTLIQISRNNKINEIPLSIVLSNPKYNVQLQNDDVITLINKPSSFISMGATGASREMKFEAVGINLSQALARIGGIRDNQADARGVFIFRYEDSSEQELVPVVYQLDLSNPNSLFVMKNFEIKDNDIVYVATAPIIELQKFLYSIFSPGIGMANQVSQIAQ